VLEPDSPLVLVTGGAGFIGSNLVRSLLATGVAAGVTVLDDLSTGDEAHLAGLDRVRFVRGSILDRDALDDAMTGATAVVHLAARPSVPRSLLDPELSHEVNATGTVRVLEAARRAGSPHVLVASSSSVYGANPHLPKHEDLATRPLSPYAASKLATEAYALAYAHSFDLPVLAFRFFNVFGPRQSAGHAYAAVVPAFLDAALRGEPLRVFGDGQQSRDFTSVESVAVVIGDAIRRRVTSPGPVNLAFGSRTTLLELIVLLEELLDRRLTVCHEPARTGDVRHSQASQEALRALFPQVAPIGLKESLRSTADWYAENLTDLGP
jgi:UDP-glucose 4-epimerase